MRWHWGSASEIEEVGPMMNRRWHNRSLPGGYLDVLYFLTLFAVAIGGAHSGRWRIHMAGKGFGQ